MLSILVFMSSTSPTLGKTKIDRYSPYRNKVEGSKDKLIFKCHPGQVRAMKSMKRFILILSGTQGGKTVLGPWWLLREIMRRGPGDYLVATPTFTLLELKALAEFKGLFEDRLQLGKYKGSPSRVFTLSDRGNKFCFTDKYGNKRFDYEDTKTRILFGYAADPESLESATVKAAWLDEAGQKKFRVGSWEAIQRRLSIHEGRVLITTTPYSLGWLKNELHDKAKQNPDGDIDLIQFDSKLNPSFPQSEFERMQAILPRWKFNMMYRGIFERPAGMIYDCFSADHKVPRFAIPDSWPRYLGLDFGGVNTAGVFIAEHPESKELFLYKTYHKGGLTAAEHAAKLMSDHQLTVYGGAKSEGQWRKEFRAAGLPIHRPKVSEVEVGINRVYGLFKTGRLKVFDDLADIISDLESYSRVLDDQGEPTEKIEDKETWHRLDGLRYIATHLNHTESSDTEVIVL